MAAKPAYKVGSRRVHSRVHAVKTTTDSRKKPISLPFDKDDCSKHRIFVDEIANLLFPVSEAASVVIYFATGYGSQRIYSAQMK